MQGLGQLHALGHTPQARVGPAQAQTISSIIHEEPEGCGSERQTPVATQVPTEVQSGPLLGSHSEQPSATTVTTNTVSTNTAQTVSARALDVTSGVIPGSHFSSGVEQQLASEGSAAQHAQQDSTAQHKNEGSTEQPTQEVQARVAEQGPSRVLLEKGVSALGTDAAYTEGEIKFLGKQLDRFKKRHLFLGQFEMLGRARRRTGGAPPFSLPTLAGWQESVPVLKQIRCAAL